MSAASVPGGEGGVPWPVPPLGAAAAEYRHLAVARLQGLSEVRVFEEDQDAGAAPASGRPGAAA